MGCVCSLYNLFLSNTWWYAFYFEFKLINKTLKNRLLFLTGLINKFLSWSVWQPFARISFATYLIHSDVLNIFNGNQIKGIYMIAIYNPSLVPVLISLRKPKKNSKKSVRFLISNGTN